VGTAGTGGERPMTQPQGSADLARRISRRIAAEGPLSVAAYMAIALHDPDAGYYATRTPIGAAGDFTTAPEISQIFGELVGLWLALAWERLGRPDSVVLAELGPGRGVLAVDLLRAAASVPGFRRALRLHLVEKSPHMRHQQERALAGSGAVWLERADDLPDGPLLLVANEFLDSLPIRQFVRRQKGWAERLVTSTPGGELVFADGPISLAAPHLVPERLRGAAPAGAVVEFCPAAVALAVALGRRFARRPGAALFIDFGDFPSRPRATLQAVRRHRPAAVLSRPGTADLSAEVDFAAFAEAARAAGGEVAGPVGQGRFLAALGAAARLEALAARAAPAQRQALAQGLARLVEPAQMGELFKVLAVTSPGLGVAAGFGGES
jgi:NADH dehydrogenase [ubiquinone] 1 alpha subcomplex assembly factor 7